MCGVVDLGRRPRRLRLAEQLEQLALGQLREGGLLRAGSAGRIVRHAADALRARPALEDQAELVPAVHRHTASRVDLPALAIDRQDADHVARPATSSRRGPRSTIPTRRARTLPAPAAGAP